LQELVEVDRSNRPHSNHRPLSNHRHNQPLMEAVEVVVEVEEAVEVVVEVEEAVEVVVEVEEAVEVEEVDQHPLQEAQHLSQLQHPKQDQMVP